MEAREIQCASRVLLVRPARFGFDEQTARSNPFQQRPVGVQATEIARRARAEIDLLAAQLERAGVAVSLLEDEAEPAKPDAVFPNNCFSTHADGTLVLYPMLARSRRLEMDRERIEELAERERLRIERVVDLSPLAERGEFLEGTGSLVLDRPRRVAYACHSPRTTAGAAREWAERLGYELVQFHAEDARGVAIYHTNVMLCLGERFAVACLDSIPDRRQRAMLSRHLEASGRELVLIDRRQMGDFCGNLLELRGLAGTPVLALSDRARRSFRADQLAILEAHARLVSSPIETIEQCGGGSVRCTLAELFLPAL